MKLPLRVTVDGGGACDVRDATGCMIVPLEEADVCDLIVRAVNAHAALLAACGAVLLFHSCGSWTEEAQNEWKALASGRECTTKVLCDIVRSAIALAEKPA